MKKTKFTPLLMTTSLVGLLGFSQLGAAAELKVIASGALKGAMQHLQPAYEKASGNTLIFSWGPSMGTSPESIPERIKHQEPMDLAIMADETLERLSKTGAFDMATRREIADSRIGVGVPHGKPTRDVSSVAALKSALLNADKIAYSQGASGVYIRAELFERLGISEQVKDKTVEIPGKELVGTALARGDADIGMQQISELKVTPGVDYLGPLPEEVQKVSRFCATVARHSENAEEARQFIAFLNSPQAHQLLEESGLEPIVAQEGKQ
ncbi:ABC transporter substrate-binding protein [Pseudomonas argentinensis]|uniref:Molybdate transport system substrate-binding protein n=1 Tax=Phytopseudomonas argentinensis TaxID=289370 RepID=A0A1I3N7J2_9GAMM|nr:molybdate ABC transporter substrate-binding protein [Pseudomonas argentinensis]KAB0550127.1 ABC transporter substrate-binding protein [Pseudomonas argentinensis]SFJ05142.1 molybdate transport system substrate-binding protein [Pseudomonas argentinensis]